MRSSSTSSSVTTQPRVPSRAIAEIESTGLPKSSATCSRAFCAISPGERFFVLVELAMQPPEQFLLDLLVRRLVDLAAFERRRRLGELGADPARIVQLSLRLVHHLLEHPCHAAGRRERKRE